MGVVYKLKPEIKEFIINRKKENPALSCRKFVGLIKEEFSLEMSKSHINSVLKESGLSGSVGRLPQEKSKRSEKKGLGIMVLEALSSLVSGDFREALYIKVGFLDGSVFYIDAQLRTVWPGVNIPVSFTSPLEKAKSDINEYLFKNKPLVLFMAPGYDALPPEFLKFIQHLIDPLQKITSVSIYGTKGEEIENLPISGKSVDKFIFGIWPWQFVSFRKINFNSTPAYFYFNPLKKDFYLSDAEVSLHLPKTAESLILRGCVLNKENQPGNRPSLLICSNLSLKEAKIEDIAEPYLNHWPNLEEAFKDYGQKIELFIKKPKEIPQMDYAALVKEGDSLAMDAYLRMNFLPVDYRQASFAVTKARFYDLKCRLVKKKDYEILAFILPQEYPYLNDLNFLCHRLNERALIMPDGKRIWFNH